MIEDPHFDIPVLGNFLGNTAATAHVERQTINAPLVPPVERRESFLVASDHPPQQSAVTESAFACHRFQLDDSLRAVVTDSESGREKFQKFHIESRTRRSSRGLRNCLAWLRRRDAGLPITFGEAICHTKAGSRPEVCVRPKVMQSGFFQPDVVVDGGATCQGERGLHRRSSHRGEVPVMGIVGSAQPDRRKRHTPPG